MYPGTEDRPRLADLARRQDGVLHRRQFAAVGVSPASVRAQLAASRWSTTGQNVVLLHNSQPARRQLMWVAVLSAGRTVALGSHTALELVGFSSVAREAELIHLIVPRGRHTIPIPGVQVHESRRLRGEHIVVDHGLPRTETPRSVIDAAAWQPWPRFACMMLAMAVQQQLCSVAELDQAMKAVGRVRHKNYLRLALADIAGGSQALSEMDVIRLCRRYGLQPPQRQVRRRDRSGTWRYLDCEWTLPNGEIVVLEIDGRHHLDVEQWQADMRRERSVVISRRRVLRATSFEARLEPEPLVADLIAIGVPRLSELSASEVALAT